MQNSLERSFLSLLHAIMQDIVAYKPVHRKDLLRDYSRISSLVSNVGHRFFTDALPTLRKQLDSSLSHSLLVLEGPFTRPYKTGSHIPRLFKGMWLELFDNDGCLKQSIDPNFVFFFRTMLDIGSKLEEKCSPTALYKEVREFYRNDVTLPPPSNVFDGDGSDLPDTNCVSLIDLHGNESDQHDLFRSHDSTNTQLLATIQRVADMVATSLGTVNSLEIGYRHGKGAVSDSLRGIEKFLPTRWSERLSRVFPVDHVALPAAYDHNYSSAEFHSELWDVIKSAKAPRLIAKEPVDHMMCQLGIMDYLYAEVPKNEYLRRSIDFRKQQYSRDLALESSKSGEYATIDLKSASDRISCWLVERIFRRNKTLLESLISCRTRYINLGIDKKHPTLHKLRKFSTQGSAVTFPIQSIIFTIICAGALLEPQASPRRVRKVLSQIRVYGDDIIVPVSGLNRVKLALEMLYLKVNTTKTHSQGKFRESCGMDAWDGNDVTPPHVTVFDSMQAKHQDPGRKKPSNGKPLAGLIEASNNFFTKGLWNASNYLLLTVPKKDRDSILVREDPDVSIHLKSFLGDFTPPTVKVRMHKDYQTKEALILTKYGKVDSLQVDGSRRLAAFLTRAEYMNRLPFLGMVPEITFSSRWEVREKVSRRWTLLPSA